MIIQPNCAERIDSEWKNIRHQLNIRLWPEDATAEEQEDIGYDPDDTGRCFWDYGLDFDYVALGTFVGQKEGYLRYQLSRGGPSDEIRFFVSPTGQGWKVHRAEYWFMDWFERRAHLDVTGDEVVEAVFEQFDDVGAVDKAINEALEEASIFYTRGSRTPPAEPS